MTPVAEFVRIPTTLTWSRYLSENNGNGCALLIAFQYRVAGRLFLSRPMRVTDKEHRAGFVNKKNGSSYSRLRFEELAGPLYVVAAASPSPT